MPIAPANRRAFRFSLSALFVVVTVSAVVFAWLRVPLEQIRREAVLAERIEQLGGRITWGCSISDGALDSLGALELLWMLHLDHAPITDKGLKSLNPLPRLRTLDLSGTRVTDAGLDLLREHTQLEMLLLNETAVTDEAISRFNNDEISNDPAMR